MFAAAFAACLALFGTQAAPNEKTTPGPQAQEVKERLQVQVDSTEITLKQGERAVLHYRYTDVPFKPYVRALYSPNGLNVLLDAPPDHLHHHGLMFAVGVDDVHFWAEDPQAGHQMHTNTGVEVRDDLAAFSGLLPWHIDSKVLVREYRRITVLHAPPGRATNLITWWTSLTPDSEAT
ncbi:MAG: PmoA family protein, partial [Planctomycetes bacterium]|nr:PmoA family protein [Planctomycetota bacterium]